MAVVKRPYPMLGALESHLWDLRDHDGMRGHGDETYQTLCGKVGYSTRGMGTSGGPLSHWENTSEYVTCAPCRDELRRRIEAFKAAGGRESDEEVTIDGSVEASAS